MSDGFFVAQLPAGVRPGDEVSLTGAEAHHAGVVRRLSRSERVTVTDGLGTGVIGRAARVAKGEVVVVVETVRRPEAPQPYIIVAQAVPKADRAALAVDLMTEAGVDEIVPWDAARCQVRWAPEKVDKARGKWVAVAREASKQARRLRFPVIGDYATAKGVARLAAEADQVIIMHERASVGIERCAVVRSGRVLIIIGPEGGLTDQEVETFVSAGGTAYLMGPTVLRTSTAGAVAVTQVRLLAALAAG